MAINVICEANKAWLTETQKITQGSVGMEVGLEFSPEWDDLSRFAVFRCYDKQRVTPVGTDDLVLIPPAVLTKAGVKLFLGIYGLNEEGTEVIPTVWCELGVVHEGANIETSDNYDVPEQALSAQILAMAHAAQQAAEIAIAGAGAASLSFTVNGQGHLIEHRSDTGSDIDLGAVSAYGEAVELGYTGSRSDFVNLLTTNMETAERVEDALTAVGTVVAAANEAKTLANAASTAAATASADASAAQSAVNNKQDKYQSGQITLAAGTTSWTPSYTYATANNLILAYPDPTNDAGYNAWSACNVRCVGQTQGMLTFKADTAPATAIQVNVVSFTK